VLLYLVHVFCFSILGSVGEKLNKGFMLRPSALTSAADKIESSNKTGTYK